jgi:hypothetical protein
VSLRSLTARPLESNYIPPNPGTSSAAIRKNSARELTLKGLVRLVTLLGYRIAAVGTSTAHALQARHTARIAALGFGVIGTTVGYIVNFMTFNPQQRAERKHQWQGSTSRHSRCLVECDYRPWGRWVTSTCLRRRTHPSLGASTSTEAPEWRAETMLRSSAVWFPVLDCSLPAGRFDGREGYI